MDANSMYALSAAICMALAVTCPALGLGISSGKAFESMARQPEKASEIRSTLILAMGFIEALSIYGLLIAFMLLGNIK